MADYSRAVVFWRAHHKVGHKLFDGIRYLDRALDSRLTHLRNFYSEQTSSRGHISAQHIVRKREMLSMYKTLCSDLRMSTLRMLQLAYYCFGVINSECDVIELGGTAKNCDTDVCSSIAYCDCDRHDTIAVLFVNNINSNRFTLPGGKVDKLGIGRS